jgi:HK97 family phage portal protein
VVDVITALARGLGVQKAQALSSVDTSRGWYPLIREPFTGAWQRNEEIRIDTALSNPVLFRCVSLISSDVSKMRCRLVQRDGNGIWTEVENPSFSPVLRKPNRFQNRIQFFANWMLSKLTHGNTYVLKQRDNRQVVTALYVLDPTRVRPLVAPDGSVYYQLASDNLVGLEAQTTVPASEIIHDRWNTLYHPLIGLSPIYACGLAAWQGLEISRASTRFFKNGSRPGGVLTAPGAINQETADRLKSSWETNFSGDNAGKVAVLGDGLTYEPMVMTAVDAQLAEQLKLSDETICGAYGVPSYMAGVGQAPLNNNVQSLAQLYYAQCLQPHIESLEECLDEGLGLLAPGSVRYGVEFDLDDLLRMDTATQVKTLSEAVGGGLMKPDEGRRKMNLAPVEGGDEVYLQQQNYSLAALAKRDAKEDPFSTAKPANDTPPDPEAQAMMAVGFLRKALEAS